MWSDVLAFLETARFDDLLLPGWIDRTGPFPVYRPFTFDACLQAESGLIQFTSVNNNGGLHIRMVDEIEYDEAFRDDPEVELLVRQSEIVILSSAFEACAVVEPAGAGLVASSPDMPAQMVLDAVPSAGE
jgi:hypothetical protein